MRVPHLVHIDPLSRPASLIQVIMRSTIVVAVLRTHGHPGTLHFADGVNLPYCNSKKLHDVSV